MKTHLIINLFFCITILTALSCQKDILEPGQKQYPGVSKEFWPYFQKFEEEGAKRGLSIDLVAAKISGKFGDLSAKGAVGQCSYGTGVKTQVVIDKKFWVSTVSTLIKELVVFHELGHCYLYRQHLEDKLPNGFCVSIMRSGTGDCLDNYNILTKDSYLDELFRG